MVAVVVSLVLVLSSLWSGFPCCGWVFFWLPPFVSKERAATQEPTNFSSRMQLIGTVQRTGTLSGIPNGCGDPPRQSAHRRSPHGQFPCVVMDQGTERAVVYFVMDAVAGARRTPGRHETGGVPPKSPATTLLALWPSAFWDFGSLHQRRRGVISYALSRQPYLLRLQGVQ